MGCKMIQTFTELYSQFLAFSSKNPVVGGMIGIWFLGVITFMLRNTPKMLMKGFMNTFTTTFNLHNGGWDYNVQLFPRFLSWYMSTSYSNFSRSLSVGELVTSGKMTEPSMAAGYGYHLFFYRGRLFILRLYPLQSPGSERVKEEMRLIMFGRNHSVIDSLMKEVWEFRPPITEQQIWSWEDNTWRRPTVLQKRTLQQVFIHDHVKSYLLERIQEFKNDRNWYMENGIPYKLNIMLEGPPGTGKTSLVKAIASELKSDICKFDTCRLEDKEIDAMVSAMDGRIGLMEDIHSSNNLIKRPDDPEERNRLNAWAPQGALSLSKFLNTLDGIESRDGSIMFATTNYIERLDDAVFRKGRFDIRIYVGMMDRVLVQQFICQMYKDCSINMLDLVPECVSLPGCDVYGIFFDHRENFPGFIEALKTAPNIPDYPRKSAIY